MTTIVADSRTGVMVSDSRATGKTTWCHVTKIYRWGDSLIGFAGDLAQSAKWLRWNNAGGHGPRPRYGKKNGGFEALILRPSGVYYLSDDHHEMLCEDGWYALGSGEAAARGAMAAGATPHLAVSLACHIDTGSGGVLHTAYLKDVS